MQHPAQEPPEIAETLRESEERFRTLVQFSFEVYWETDAQHRFIRQEFANTLADHPVSEIGKTRWEVPYLEPDEEGWRKHRETLDAHLPFRDFELARPTPEGGKRYVSVSGLPIFDKTGRFVGYRGMSSMRWSTDSPMPSSTPQHSSMPWRRTSWQVSNRSRQVCVLTILGKNERLVSRLWL